MEIVSTCLVRDLPVYQFTAESLIRHVPDCELHVITRQEDFSKFRNVCGSELHLHDERDLVPHMTLESLRQHPLPFFPAGAGWYFQQFLKWAFMEHSNSSPHYLIWDADTVLLRPLEFTDNQSRVFLTTAVEYHTPYFETFFQLFDETPHEQLSFISQHQLIDKSILRELLAELNAKSPSARGWAWAIIENLRGQGTNLFSEYETYGHFLRLRHPHTSTLRELPWTRDGRKLAGYPPTLDALDRLTEYHAYAAFESNKSLRGYCIHRLRKILNWY